ncbi:DNA internalization-related competence protein ComEC/Rec2 [Marinobacter halophilus]|uniref:DNA internalization-related competence protein ComEC/Rec2 n=1 Tax=Marinobacter halophilus TaxID=1323740 RepID=A0A2T1KB72_9GAMM|nr:DNA internalization-related competence protein ComEC/Rec2 [Marinobacter halophilus]
MLCNDQTPETGERGIPCVIAFSCGVILLYQLTVLPPHPWLFLAMFVLAGTAVLHKVTILRRLCQWVALLILGLAWASWHADARLSERLPGELEGARLVVSGYVCDLPQTGSFDSLRFSFCVSRWHDRDERANVQSLPRKIRLSWYGRDGKTLPGPLLKLDVVLKRPHGTLNSEGFRYENWLFRHGYRATGTVRAVTKDATVNCGWHCRYHRWHQWVAATAHQRFSQARQYPLIASLLIGNRGDLTDQHWQTLRATGTIHLVAISGLHLGLVAIGAGLIARRLALAAPARWGGERARRRAGFVLVLAACLFYALVAGFSVPTQRALIMVVVGGWYLLLAQEVSVWRPYAVALFLVLVLDPFAPLDQGFWLSFGAVAVLIMVFSGRMGSPGWLKGLVLAQLAVFAGLWPLLAGLGQSQPVAGLLANLLAIPWVSFVCMPVLFVGAFLVLLSGGAFTGWVISVFDLVLGLLMDWLVWVETLATPVAALTPTASPALLAMLAGVVLLLLRYPDRHFRLMAAGLIGVWMLVSTGADQSPSNPTIDRPEIRLWDVGQGLSVLVRVGNKVLVYDTGPELRGVFSAVESTLIPNLRALAVRKIDHLVLSHGDSDHAGGLEQLTTTLAVGLISGGEPEVVADKLGGNSVFGVAACPTENVRWQGLSFEFWHSNSEQSGNDASCVLRIHHAESSTDVWLTGDISRRVEAEMLGSGGVAWFDQVVENRVVLAPHHGSKTSSSAAWVNALNADRVIYTAGYRHRFGHPHPDVVDRYRAAGVPTLNTACSGEIVITLGRDGPEISELRHSAPFWIGGRGLTRDQCNSP